MTAHLIVRAVTSARRSSAFATSRVASHRPCSRWHSSHIARETSGPLTKRQRRDNYWIPSLNLKRQNEDVDATQLLIRAGYLQKAYSGIYHMLPLGLRVQNKVESLIDKHMQSIFASKVSLSSISSQSLWKRSGRLSGGSEFFKFSDRRDGKWLLAPTHEEEITNLVRDKAHSPNQFPIRLYQISRKYRDEKRPRGGLLRGKEFIMKDLYTFDLNQADAHATYEQVRSAYRNFFDELKLPYVEARADSGNMGGSLSHEYHFPSSAGEDDIISCEFCNYARNEEWVPDCAYKLEDPTFSDKVDPLGFPDSAIISQAFVDRSRTNLVKAFAGHKNANGKIVEINAHAVKAVFKSSEEIDTGIEQPQQIFEAAAAEEPSIKRTVYYLFDETLDSATAHVIVSRDKEWLSRSNLDSKIVKPISESSPMPSLLKASSGDKCPQCTDGKLKVRKAIEIGHTFHLGTRYSSKLGLHVKMKDSATESTAIEMGCHGIGVSRLLAAIASTLSDSTGLVWPAAIAPFQVIIISDHNESTDRSAAEAFYDKLSGSDYGLDVLLDDRPNVSMGYKLKDADLIGYPTIVVFGRKYRDSGLVEVQSRRLNIKEFVESELAPETVYNLVSNL